jgi:prophage maintenance system killer protein
MIDKGEVIIYKSPSGETAIDVKLQDETVWLSQKLMADLFDKDIRTINEHIKNIYNEGELDENPTIRNFRIVQKEKNRDVKREVMFYNLDVIISVGYRVKSQRGTQFRIWANKVLKEYLVKGYALNEKRLKEQNEKFKELEKSIEIFKRIAENSRLEQDQFTGILKVISDYTYALDILDKYDHQKVETGETEKSEAYRITYADSIEIVKRLKEKFGGSKLFGKEKDESFKSTIETIYQTFNAKELYPGIEEKAAMLLYLAVKNHSFIDGNKRIAAAIFLMFLERNKCLYRNDGSKRIADNALVALCLMIASSDPKEKDIIKSVIVNLINKKN